MGSTSNQSLRVILGGGTMGGKEGSSHAKVNSPESLQQLLAVFRAHGHNTLDTSRAYPSSNPGGSEALLGTTDLSWAKVDTKVTSTAGSHASDKIASSISTSLATLKIPQINTIYLHWPDRTIPLPTVIPAIASAVQNGHARHWAISNYSTDEVTQIVEICKSHSLPLPTCYQGHYNALTRRAEESLLPLLRRHNIAFYAYSPAAGGALGANSRMQRDDRVGAITREFYGAPKQQAAVAQVQELARREGISGHEVALRWVQYHSALDAALGDAMVIAASSATQLEDTLVGLEKGPLPEDVVAAIEQAWEEAKETAPDYSPFLEDRKWS